VNNDDWNNEEENSVTSDDIRSNTPILDQSKRKNESLRRRQTIDTAQARQYQTALKQ